MTDRPSSEDLEAISHLAQQGRYDDALKLGADLQERYPASAHLHRELAHVHEVMKNLDLAVQEISEAIRLAPGEPDYHFNRGRWCLELGRCDEAIIACTSAIAIETGLGRVYYLGASHFIRALAKARRGEDRGALDDCQHVADDTVLWVLGAVQSKTALVSLLKQRLDEQ